MCVGCCHVDKLAQAAYSDRGATENSSVAAGNQT